MKLTSWILTCFFLMGCGITTPLTATVPTQIFVPLVLINETPTTAQKPTRINTLTRIKTPIQIMTPTASLTPLPTYSVPGSARKIHQLLLNNGLCHLPCFWGIIPGKTSTAEFIQFVNQFPEQAEWMSKGKEFYTFYYVPPLNTDTTSSILFFDEDNLIEAVGIKLESAYLSFPLTRLLSEYGMPDLVMIGQSDLFVLYEKQRIVGQYRLSFNQPGYVCLDPKSVVGIITWAEGKDWLGYVNQLFGSLTTTIPRPSLRPIDQVVTYDMDDFFKQFSTKNRTTCMEVLKTKP